MIKRSNPYYQMRNGDASILVENTELYKINDEKYTNRIAAKINNIYYLYMSK